MPTVTLMIGAIIVAIIVLLFIFGLPYFLGSFQERLLGSGTEMVLTGFMIGIPASLLFLVGIYETQPSTIDGTVIAGFAKIVEVILPFLPIFWSMVKIVFTVFVVPAIIPYVLASYSKYVTGEGAVYLWFISIFVVNAAIYDIFGTAFWA